MIRNVLLWIFGLIPAVVWAAWSALYALLALLAIFSSPAQSILYAGIASLSAYGGLSVVLAIVGRPRADIKQGLIVALVILIPSVFLAAFSELGGTESFAVLIGFGLITVTAFLLKEHIERSQT